MDVSVGVEKEALFAMWLGLPGDADAEELARRIEQINKLDDVTRHRVRKELRALLAEMLADEQGDTAVAV
jgi:hypothetical protein